MRTRIAQLATVAVLAFVTAFCIWLVAGYGARRATVSATAYAVGFTALAPFARRYGRKWRSDGSVPVRWRTDSGGTWSRRLGGGLKPVYGGVELVRRGDTVLWLLAAEVRGVAERPSTWREVPVTLAPTSIVTVETAAAKVELQLEAVHLPELRRWLGR